MHDWAINLFFYCCGFVNICLCIDHTLIVLLDGYTQFGCTMPRLTAVHAYTAQPVPRFTGGSLVTHKFLRFAVVLCLEDSHALRLLMPRFTGGSRGDILNPCPGSPVARGLHTIFPGFPVVLCATPPFQHTTLTTRCRLAAVIRCLMLVTRCLNKKKLGLWLGIACPHTWLVEVLALQLPWSRLDSLLRRGQIRLSTQKFKRRN